METSHTNYQCQTIILEKRVTLIFHIQVRMLPLNQQRVREKMTVHPDFRRIREVRTPLQGKWAEINVSLRPNNLFLSFTFLFPLLMK